MIHYYTDINQLDSFYYKELMNYVSKSRKKRIQHLLGLEERKRCLLTECLARYAICRKFSCENAAIEFELTKYGKPIVKNNQDYHFNCAHSGRYVLATVADTSVGVDIEEIRPMNFSIARNFLCQEEYQVLSATDEIDKVVKFLQFWTLKESYVKYLGCDLMTSLKHYCFKIQQSSISMKAEGANDFGGQTERFDFIFLPEGFVGAVCHTGKSGGRCKYVAPEKILAELQDV